MWLSKTSHCNPKPRGFFGSRKKPDETLGQSQRADLVVPKKSSRAPVSPPLSQPAKVLRALREEEGKEKPKHGLGGTPSSCLSFILFIFLPVCVFVSLSPNRFKVQQSCFL